MRILHVENDPASAKAVALMLDGVVEACEWTPLGEGALQLAERNGYDLILLDVMLPDIDGYAVLERLRSAGVSTPCLILSGLVDRESEFGSLAFGVGDYLAKPFTRDELVNRMQAVLARSGLASAAAPAADSPLQPPPRWDGEERRKYRRFRTIKTGRIDHGPGIECRILNMSHGGAMIRLPAENTKLPSSFLMTLADGTSHLCRTIWRDGDRMGVKFPGRG